MKTRKERALADPTITHVAFWPYDRFPYFLGTGVRVLKVDTHGKATVYAPSYQGSPAFLSEEIDKYAVYIDEIEKLEDEYRTALSKLNEEFMNKAKARVPFLATHFDVYKRVKK